MIIIIILVELTELTEKLLARIKYKASVQSKMHIYRKCYVYSWLWSAANKNISN